MGPPPFPGQDEKAGEGEKDGGGGGGVPRL